MHWPRRSRCPCRRIHRVGSGRHGRGTDLRLMHLPVGVAKIWLLVSAWARSFTLSFTVSCSWRWLMRQGEEPSEWISDGDLKMNNAELRVLEESKSICITSRRAKLHKPPNSHIPYIGMGSHANPKLEANTHWKTRKSLGISFDLIERCYPQIDCMGQALADREGGSGGVCNIYPAL